MKQCQTRNFNKISQVKHTIMSRQVDFYITQKTSFDELGDLCLKLILKAYHHRFSLDVRFDSEALTRTMDCKLWNHDRDSFTPHEISKTFTNTIHVAPLSGKRSVAMINCSGSSDIAHNDWVRLLQIVPNQQPLLEQARQQYRHYKQLGYNVNTHKIG